MSGKAILYRYQDTLYSLRELAAHTGMSFYTLRERLQIRRLPVDVAVEHPIQRRSDLLDTPLEHAGHCYPIHVWARLVGLSAACVRARIKADWPAFSVIDTPTPKQRRRGVVSNLAAFFGPARGAPHNAADNIVSTNTASDE